MMPPTFIPSSTILWNDNQQLQLQHAFHAAASSFSVTSFPRARAALHLQENNDDVDDDSNNLQVTTNEDNLLLPTAIFVLTSMLSSLITLWSEYSVLMTGCGPLSLPDWLERSSYLGVLVVAELSVFVRIVSGGQSLSSIYEDNMNRSSEKYNQYVSLVENVSLLVVVGAFVALGMQSIKGEQMDGLSGINVDMCRAIQQNASESVL